MQERPLNLTRVEKVDRAENLHKFRQIEEVRGAIRPRRPGFMVDNYSSMGKRFPKLEPLRS